MIEWHTDICGPFFVTFGEHFENHMGDLLRIALDYFESVPNIFLTRKTKRETGKPSHQTGLFGWPQQYDSSDLEGQALTALGPYRPSRLGCKHSSTKPSSATFRQTWRFLLGQFFTEKKGQVPNINECQPARWCLWWYHAKPADGNAIYPLSLVEAGAAEALLLLLLSLSQCPTPPTVSAAAVSTTTPTTPPTTTPTPTATTTTTTTATATATRTLTTTYYYHHHYQPLARKNRERQ